ncbi:MAG TPA: hypothetical protein VLF68_01380 [Candidatus Saccharimonadales bacterium]|nr:hypothetical protein [Candidatus Saccharimonadales bacterium]
MKNNRVLIGIAVLVVVIIVGGIFVLSSRNSSSKQATQNSEDVVIPTLTPDEIGLTMTARDDKKAVKFVISKVDGITGVDYELTYNTGANVPRGVIGHIDVTPGMSTITPNNPDTNGYIILGTSSSGKYKYDEGVTSVKLTLKITKNNNKVYQVEKTLDL